MHLSPASGSSLTRSLSALAPRRAMQRDALDRAITSANSPKGARFFLSMSARLSATEHFGLRTKSAAAAAPSQKTAGVTVVPFGSGHPGQPGSAISVEASVLG